MAKNKKKKKNLPVSKAPSNLEAEKVSDLLNDTENQEIDREALEQEILSMLNLSSAEEAAEKDIMDALTEELLKDMKEDDSVDASGDLPSFNMLFKEIESSASSDESKTADEDKETEAVMAFSDLISEDEKDVTRTFSVTAENSEGPKEQASEAAEEIKEVPGSNNTNNSLKKKNKKKKNSSFIAQVSVSSPKESELLQEVEQSTEKVSETDIASQSNAEPQIKESDFTEKETPFSANEEMKEEHKAERKPKERKHIKEGSPLYMIRLVVVLALICTAISGLLAVVNHITKDTISENNRKAREEAVLTVFPEGDSCKEYVAPCGTVLYFAAKGDTVIGYCVNVSPAGYGGNIDMMVGVSTDGTISGIKIVKLSETPGVGTKVMGDSFLAQFLGFDGSVPLVVGENVDGIGGATFSSKAVAEGVNEAMSVDFDIAAAVTELGLKLPENVSTPDETEDSNADNGDETLNPGEVGEIGETDPTETRAPETTPGETEPSEVIPVETGAPETIPSETDAPETLPPVIVPIETDPVIPETDPPSIPETTDWIPETVIPETEAPETLPPETEAPETLPPETEAPETLPPETEAPETLPPETEAPETLPPETEAPETLPPETEPIDMELNLTLRAVDAEGNVISNDENVLDCKLNNEHWLSTSYPSGYTVRIGENIINNWDSIPGGYYGPEDMIVTVTKDGTVYVDSDSALVEYDGDLVIIVITLEREEE